MAYPIPTPGPCPTGAYATGCPPPVGPYGDPCFTPPVCGASPCPPGGSSAPVPPTYAQQFGPPPTSTQASGGQQGAPYPPGAAPLGSGYQQGPPPAGAYPPPAGNYQQGPAGGYPQGPPPGGYSPPDYQQGPPPTGSSQQGPPPGDYSPYGGYQQGPPPPGGYSQPGQGPPPAGAYPPPAGNYQQGPAGGYPQGPPPGGYSPPGYQQGPPPPGGPYGGYQQGPPGAPSYQPNQYPPDQRDVGPPGAYGAAAPYPGAPANSPYPGPPGGSPYPGGPPGGPPYSGGAPPYGGPANQPGADPSRGWGQMLVAGGLGAAGGYAAGHFTSGPYSGPRWERVQRVAAAHGLSEKATKELMLLDGYELVVIADDSGSMRMQQRGGGTRWDELRKRLIVMTDLAVALDDDGIDVYFLNHGTERNVKSAAQVQQILARVRPDGLTPLCATLERVMNERRGGKNRDIKTNLIAGGIGAAAGYFAGHSGPANQGSKGVMILIATDGCPSDGAPRLKQILCQRNADFFPVCFMACTDNPNDVAYMNGLDVQCPKVDVVDDYEAEAAEVQRTKGYRLSYGDYLCKAMVGPLSNLDAYDERR